jgi:uncharacterized membrane protein (UPF0127 family)
MMVARKILSAVAVASIGLAACGPIDAKTSPRTAHVKLVPLDIQTAKGVLHYKVEVATTSQEQAKGLMFRTSLPERGGMIFPMKPPRFASFWMKNTLISLDIIFIRPDHTIESIAANAVPQDLTPLESGEPVAAVLEIAGGEAARIGIAPGDKISW